MSEAKTAAESTAESKGSAEEDKAPVRISELRRMTAQELPPAVPYFSLYRFADPLVGTCTPPIHSRAQDIFLVVFGSLCAMAHGAMQPLFTILFGQVGCVAHVIANVAAAD